MKIRGYSRPIVFTEFFEHEFLKWITNEHELEIQRMDICGGKAASMVG